MSNHQLQHDIIRRAGQTMADAELDLSQRFIVVIDHGEDRVRLSIASVKMLNLPKPAYYSAAISNSGGSLQLARPAGENAADLNPVKVYSTIGFKISVTGPKCKPRIGRTSPVKRSG